MNSGKELIGEMHAVDFGLCPGCSGLVDKPGFCKACSEALELKAKDVQVRLLVQLVAKLLGQLGRAEGPDIELVEQVRLSIAAVRTNL